MQFQLKSLQCFITQRLFLKASEYLFSSGSVRPNICMKIMNRHRHQDERRKKSSSSLMLASIQAQAGPTESLRCEKTI